MIRSLHRWPGLIAAPLRLVQSLSGAAVPRQMKSPHVGSRAAPFSGAIIDTATGAGVGLADATATATATATELWLKNLHRLLFLDDTGRIVAAPGAAAMQVLSLSGARGGRVAGGGCLPG